MTRLNHLPMKTRATLLALCFAGLGVSLWAGGQNPPPPPPAPPPPPPSQGRGVVGGIPLPASQPGRSSIPPAPLVTTSVIVGRVIDPATGKGVSGAVVTLHGGPTRVAQPSSTGHADDAAGAPAAAATNPDGRRGPLRVHEPDARQLHAHGIEVRIHGGSATGGFDRTGRRDQFSSTTARRWRTPRFGSSSSRPSLER